MAQEMKKQQRATIDDVAKLAGVSKTTISRYLSGHFHMLSDQTRQRIKETIEQLEYRPSKMARGLKRNRSFLIGMVVADLTNPFTTAVLRGAEDVCKKSGYSLMLCNTNNDPVQERDYIFMLQEHRIDGLVINTTGLNNEFLHELAGDETPIVLVDRKVPELGFDMVSVDNEHTTRELITHLLDQGYEHIAFVTEPIDGVSSRKERLRAFEDVMQQVGSSGVAHVYEVDVRESELLQAQLGNFLERSAGKTRAVFAANGVVLLKVILALQARGVQIPGDLAVTGFDDPEWATLVGGGITTVAQPTFQIGVAAMERVIRRIEGDRSEGQLLELGGRLIIRGSTPDVTQ